jgi:UDP-glucose 4-epimerase
MARVLITGVAGFLGSHLAEKMLAEGHSVVGVDNLSGGVKENVLAGVDFWGLDCATSWRNLNDILAKTDVIYHCAASPHEGLSLFSPIKITRDTFGSTVWLATAAINAKVKRFVFCSSMARYGNLQVRPFREDMVCYPADPYGVAKLASEQTLLCLSRTHGMEVVILVPHNIIGERQKYDDPYRNVAAIMINRMLHGKQPIIYGDGYQERCFTYVGDVMDCFVCAGFQDNLNGEIINIGPDDKPTCIGTLAALIAQLLGWQSKDFHPIYMEARPGEVKSAWCSADKARHLLGYETKTSLPQALEKMIAYIKEKGPKPFNYHIPLEIESDKCPRPWKERLM